MRTNVGQSVALGSPEPAYDPHVLAQLAAAVGHQPSRQPQRLAIILGLELGGDPDLPECAQLGHGVARRR